MLSVNSKLKDRVNKTLDTGINTNVCNIIQDKLTMLSTKIPFCGLTTEEYTSASVIFLIILHSITRKRKETIPKPRMAFREQ